MQSVSGEGDASKTAHLYMQGVDICKRKRNRKRYWEQSGGERRARRCARTGHPDGTRELPFFCESLRLCVRPKTLREREKQCDLSEFC